MEKIFRIAQYLMESTVSKSGYLEVSNFLKTNISKTSPASIVLRGKYLKYISHHEWIYHNFLMLQIYDVIDNTTGKIHHPPWLYKVGQVSSDDPSMKNSLLHTLI